MANNVQSITSVNAVLTLVIPGVYSAPVTIQGFSADDMFDLEPFPKVEVRMGMDGKQAQGYVIHNRPMKIKLEANSPSGIVFDNWAQAMDVAQDAIAASGSIILKGNGLQATLTNGGLTKYSDVPAAKKTLQPQDYEITWESVTISQM